MPEIWTGLDPLKDYYRHFDITRKNCPTFWVSNPAEFEQFKHDVKNKLNGDGLTLSQYTELKAAIEKVDRMVTGLVDNDGKPDEYAVKSLEWAKENGISTGERPQGLTKREETVTIAKNLNDFFDEKLKKVSVCTCAKGEGK